MNEPVNVNPALVIQALSNQIAEMAQKIAVLEALLNQKNDENREQ